MRGESLASETAISDVHHALLPEAPAVALQVAREIELGHFRAYEAVRALVERHLELLRRDDGLASTASAQMTGDGTEVSARAHDDRRLDLVVHDPALAFTAQPAERGARAHLGAR